MKRRGIASKLHQQHIRLWQIGQAMLSRVGRRCGASIAAAAFANVIYRPVRPLPPFFSHGGAGSVRGTDLFGGSSASPQPPRRRCGILRRRHPSM